MYVDQNDTVWSFCCYSLHRRWRGKETVMTAKSPREQRRRLKRRDSWRSKSWRRRSKIAGDGLKNTVLFISHWPPQPISAACSHAYNQTENQCKIAGPVRLTRNTACLQPFMVLLFTRWEEEKYEDGVKWRFLEHSGPYFPPEYQPLPDDVHFYYNGRSTGEEELVRWTCSSTVISQLFWRHPESKRKKAPANECQIYAGSHLVTDWWL